MNNNDQLAKRQNLLKLDELLRRENGVTINEILDEIPDISRRTFHNYRSDLEELYGARIDKGNRGKFTTYRYSNPEFSIREQITQELNFNVETIKNALENLELMGGDDANNSMIRLFLLGIENDLLLDHKPFMAFDNNIDLKGIDRLEQLGEAIIGKTPLLLRYKPFYEDEKTFVIHPYFLKQSNNRWFLLAWSEQAKRIHNYALDRIVDFQPAVGIKYLPTNKDFTEYFDDIIGVTNYDSRRVETIVLRVSKRRYDYIRTKPLHMSQKLIKDKETEDSYFVELKVKINIELTKLLLSYGANVEVVAPRSFRDTMKEITKNMANNYKV